MPAQLASDGVVVVDVRDFLLLSSCSGVRRSRHCIRSMADSHHPSLVPNATFLPFKADAEELMQLLRGTTPTSRARGRQSAGDFHADAYTKEGIASEIPVSSREPTSGLT